MFINNNFADKAQKIAFTVVVLSIIGLITIPLFPWFGLRDENYNSQTDEYVTITDYYYGNSGILHIYVDSPWLPDDYEDIEGDISMIAICFWVLLFLGIIAICGVAVCRIRRAEGLAHILFLIGALLIIFSILAMVSHVSLMSHIDDLEDEKNEGLDPEDRIELLYGYNYIPLVMTIMLIIMSLVYLVAIVPFSMRALSRMGGGPRYGAPYPYQQYPYRPIDYREQARGYPEEPREYTGKPPEDTTEPSETPGEPRQDSPQPPQLSQGIRACINCGRPLLPDVDICPNCRYDQTHPPPPPP